MERGENEDKSKNRVVEPWMVEDLWHTSSFVGVEEMRRLPFAILRATRRKSSSFDTRTIVLYTGVTHEM